LIVRSEIGERRREVDEEDEDEDDGC